MNRHIDPAVKAANQKAYKARYYKKNKARIRRRNEEYRQQNYEKVEAQKFKYYLRYKFGIEIEDYQRLREKQNFKCAICGYAEPPNASTTEKLYVDHNHATGYIRGLLCMSCNTALGHFRESLTFLKNAVNYLENYERPCNNPENQGHQAAHQCG